MAASHDGVWNTGGPHVDIVVVPPFWRTWWFIGLALAATVTAASPDMNTGCGECGDCMRCRRSSRSD